MSSLFVRRVAGFTFIGIFFVAAVFLLLADRSGSVLDDVREAVLKIGQQLEQSYDVDVIDRDEIPGSADQLGHAMLWGTGMLLVGWFLRRRVPIPITALLIAGVSVAFEISQPFLSSTRAFEPSDAVGNIAGIISATFVLGIVLWACRRLIGATASLSTS